MSTLIATGLTQSLGSTDIFAGISLSLEKTDKVGLIGPNGIGKTTLLKVLAGLEKPSAGSLVLSKGARVGYLPQEAYTAFDGAGTVRDEMYAAFADVRAIETRMRALEHEMAHHASDGALAALNEYGELQEQFEARGGYDMEDRINNTLAGLGLDETLANLPASQLSGGQKTRALLARLLLARPDILMMDEPTNHLDIGAIEWLEGTLNAWPGALIVVSHDRLFLDRVVNRIWDLQKRTFRADKYDDRVWEMFRSKLESYAGNYTAYLTLRDERLERSRFIFNQEKGRLENDLRLIKRDLDAVKAGNDKVVTWAKGKLRLLTRDVVVMERLGAEALQDASWSANFEAMGGFKSTPFGLEEAERRVRSLSAPQAPPRPMLQLKAASRGSNIVVATRGLVAGYDGVPLFAADDIELRWQERVALIGANGAGKTTFLKTALGVLAPLAGEAILGDSVRPGYFAQVHDTLDANASLMDEMLRHTQTHRKLSEGEARHHLARFLFRDDEVFKQVGALSGGEHSRLALAILSLQGTNLLILDEPTNHLDLGALDVLESALAAYDGTILVVSHDRMLISRLATQIWHIDPPDPVRAPAHTNGIGRLRAFRGTYEEYVRERQKQPMMRAARPAAKPIALNGADATSDKNSSSTSIAAAATQTNRVNISDSKNDSKNAQQQRARQLAALEAEITRLETMQASLTTQIQQAGERRDETRVRLLSRDYGQTESALRAALEKWERDST